MRHINLDFLKNTCKKIFRIIRHMSIKPNPQKQFIKCILPRKDLGVYILDNNILVRKFDRDSSAARPDT